MGITTLVILCFVKLIFCIHSKNETLEMCSLTRDY